MAAIFSSAGDFLEFTSWLRDVVFHYRETVYFVLRQVLDRFPFPVPDEVIPSAVGVVFMLSLAVGARVSGGKPPENVSWKNVWILTALGLGQCLSIAAISFMFPNDPIYKFIPTLLFGPLFFLWLNSLDWNSERDGWIFYFSSFLIVVTFIVIVILPWWIIWGPVAGCLLIPALVALADIKAVARRLIYIWAAVGIVLLIAFVTDGVEWPNWSNTGAVAAPVAQVGS